MRAIILAAGRGSRLAGDNPRNLPKCLLEFGGKSLLQRHLELLWQHGIAQADLVIGFAADQVIDHVGRLAVRPSVAFHFNSRFEQGSVLSLLYAREALETGEEVLLMDADVLYHPAILARLVNSQYANCLLLDREYAPGDEPVKVAIRAGVIVDFRKRLAGDLDYDQIGESVGFFRFDAGMAATIAAECAQFEADGMGDAPHEEAIRNVVLRRPGAFGYEDVTGLPWVEIDFAEDLRRARYEVLPAIRRDNSDF